jgi:hypothetical protein
MTFGSLARLESESDVSKSACSGAACSENAERKARDVEKSSSSSGCRLLLFCWLFAWPWPGRKGPLEGKAPDSFCRGDPLVEVEQTQSRSLPKCRREAEGGFWSLGVSPRSREISRVWVWVWVEMSMAYDTE